MRVVGGMFIVMAVTFAHTQVPDTLWTKTYGGAGEESGNSVQQTSDGGYIVTGFTGSYGAGGSHIWLVRTEPDVGVQEHESLVVTSEAITATIFRAPLQLPKGKKWKIYDITGKVMDPYDLWSGIYFIAIAGVWNMEW
ncbi:MAG: hypothetical protein JSU64_05155 [candidate division WOR-3 bacterium]|nr:MAG: hypothetical protein JSU64_05155 [candidate division WOR-3 bacterium]